MSKKDNLASIKQQAWSKIMSKNYSEAVSLFSEATRINKKDFECWFVLGGLYGQLGQYAKAEVCSRKAINLHSASAEAHDNLGIALLEQGKAEEAASCHKRAIKLNPGFSQAYYHLGNAYRAIGDFIHAEKYYRDAITINENLVEAHNNLGNTLLELGKPEEAEQAFRNAIRIHPSFPEAFKNLGITLQKRGSLTEAIEALNNGLNYEPGNASIHTHLGSIYRDLGRMDESISHLEKAIELDLDRLDTRAALCNALTRHGKSEQAMIVAQELVKQFPDSPDAIAAISNVHEKLGDYERANQLLQDIKDKHPGNINIAMSMGLLCSKLDIEQEAINRLEAALNSGDNIDVNTSIQLYTLLGNLYDKTGKFGKAFDNYRRANELKYYPIEMPGYEQEFKRLEQTFSKKFFKDFQDAGNTSELPVFILGMPRSGTSLVEQILGSHPQIYGAGELESFFEFTRSLPGASGTSSQYPECTSSITEEIINAYALLYLQKAGARAGGAMRITDKMPHNFLHLGLIQLFFPGARVIHCIRDPRDTCLSCYFQDFGARHPYSNNLSSLGKYYRLYQGLMRHWETTLDIPILNIEYEKLVLNTEEYSKRLVDFCGLDWYEDCLRFYENSRIVHTASYNQVRQPIYKNSLDRWKKYERYIDPLMSALAG